MKINIGNIPQAIMFFIAGSVINIIMYYVFSPSQANMIGILSGIAGDALDAKTTGIVFASILIVAILISMIYPMMLIFDNNEGEDE